MSESKTDPTAKDAGPGTTQGQAPAAQTISLSKAELDSLISSAVQSGLNAARVRPPADPDAVLHSMTGKGMFRLSRMYDSHANSGKIHIWFGELETWMDLHGADARNPAHSGACAKMLMGSCSGEAAAFLRREYLNGNSAMQHYQGMKELMYARFGRQEDHERARLQLQALRKRGNMTAREYSDKFLALLDDLPPMPFSESQMQFHQGLSRQEQSLMRLANPTNVREMVETAVRVLDTGPLPTGGSGGSGPEPMDLGALSQALANLSRDQAAELAPQLSRLGWSRGDGGGGSGGGRAGPYRQQQWRPLQPPDPRKSKNWPRWLRLSDEEFEQRKQDGRCYVCGTTYHKWGECPKLKSSGNGRSPSPGRGTGRESSRSPPRWGPKQGPPNGHGPRRGG